MIITAKTIITGDGVTVLRDGGVVICGDRIKDVGPLAELKRLYVDEEVIDYGEATIIPGMIDMHLHLGFWQGRPDEALYTDHLISYLALNNAQRMLFGGVTTVRDAYCPNGTCRQLSLAAKKGWVKVPRIIHCNRALCITGGIDWQGGGGTVQVDGPEEIRKAVRTEFREGAQWIKAMTSYRTPGVAEFDQDELNMIVHECHRLGHKAMAHATMDPALQWCINAGFDTIEHGTELTLEQARTMIDKGMSWVPTIYIHKAIYERLDAVVQEKGYDALTDREKQTHRLYGKTMETYRKNFLDLYNTGLHTMAGTDCVSAGLEDITIAWELECMVELGLDPVKAIEVGTRNGAKVLDMEGEIGELRTDAIADVVVVDGDASKDITALKRVLEVYQSGEKIHRGF